jgi:hypothetical protein
VEVFLPQAFPVLDSESKDTSGHHHHCHQLGHRSGGFTSQVAKVRRQVMSYPQSMEASPHTIASTEAQFSMLFKNPSLLPPDQDLTAAQILHPRSDYLSACPTSFIFPVNVLYLSREITPAARCSKSSFYVYTSSSAQQLQLQYNNAEARLRTDEYQSALP